MPFFLPHISVQVPRHLAIFNLLGRSLLEANLKKTSMAGPTWQSK